MDDETLAGIVIHLIGRHLGVPESKINWHSIIIDDLGADSLDCIELWMAVEAKFETEICDEEAGKIITVSDLIRLVKRKQMEAA
jgi:acyl carrier protein